jgi:hypothetical protein
MKVKKYIIGISLIISLLAFFVGCGSITREEKDTFTITEIDTTFTNFVKNSPANKDNGTVFPSSKEVLVERNLTQRDSEYTRYYPDFIRLGFFESIGIVTGNTDNGIGTGLFGLFPMDNISQSFRGKSGKTFVGGIYRLGIGEWRLRWFRDAPNWTYGISLFEALIPDAKAEDILTAIYPFYIRKRFYLKETIPYVAVTPSLGIGLLPSQYLNLSVSLDGGSIGGFNVRAYLGFAVGYNSKTTPQIKNNDYIHSDKTISFPYAGLGISFLDFLNIVPETLVEWKDYQHSSWELGLIEMSLLTTNSKKSIFGDTTNTSALSGFDLQIAKTNIAIPVLDNRFYVGTSLIRFLGLGRNTWVMAVMPIRFGYWHTLVEDELTTTPFLEFGYYPSYYMNIGGEVNLRISDNVNIGLKGGYINGDSGNILGGSLVNNFGIANTFSNLYFGVSLRLIDDIFFENQLRYNRRDLPKEPKIYK